MTRSPSAGSPRSAAPSARPTCCRSATRSASATSRAAIELDETTVTFEVTCETTAQTGVEMEALTGAAAAALCLYDMTKSLDPTGAIESILLLAKSGGKSGVWTRP